MPRDISVKEAEREATAAVKRGEFATATKTDWLCVVPEARATIEIWKRDGDYVGFRRVSLFRRRYKGRTLRSCLAKLTKRIKGE